MPFTLTSPFFQLTINLETASWSLHSDQKNSPFIEDAWMQVSYRRKNKRIEALQSWPGAELHGPRAISSKHGDAQQMALTLGPDKNGLHYKIEFNLPERHPLFLWRLTLENQGEYPVEIDRLQMMQAGVFPKEKRFLSPGILTKRYQKKTATSGAIRPHPDPGDLAFFSNGWQSWSYTGTYGSNENHRGTNLGFLTSPIWFNAGTPRPKKPGHFVSDMFGVLGDRQHRSGILAGFLSQQQHFGSLEASTAALYPALALWANGDQARLDPGTQMRTDWAAIQFVDIDSPDPLAPYLKAVSREHRLQASTRHQQPSIGWCSWYQFYQHISEEIIRANLQSAAETKREVPFDLFQIDDGFEAQIGDWLTSSSGFPNGVAPLAAEIKQTGFTPGLWLAPFIVHPKSELKRQHPDWLLRNQRGRPVNAGFVWNTLNTALDLTHPDALAYAQEVLHTTAHDWGYPFIKLDFLYAAALDGVYQDRTKTRAQVLRLGLETLREAAGPDVHLLGCGVPLGAAIGIFDSVRIGADVAPHWKPAFSGLEFPFRNEFPMPSTRNAIQNALTRAPLHQRWWINDPDCLLVRPESDLTLAEVQSLATVIALTGGTLLLSDDLPKLPADRLQIAKQLVPLINQRPRVLDWFDRATPHLLRLDPESAVGQWHLLAVFNWEDESQDVNLALEKFALPAGDYLAREFWSSTITRITGGSLTLQKIPAHGVRLLALRPAQPEQSYYLGSDLHISQGLEITQWSETPTNCRLRVERPGKIRGQIDLYLPRPPAKITIQQKEIHGSSGSPLPHESPKTPIDWQVLEKDIYRLAVEFEESAEIEIN